MSEQTLPYGSWPTPITSERVVSAAVAPGEVVLEGGDLWWAESRPGEGGRTQLVRLTAAGERCDVLPRDANVRTAVHEYGGRAWWVHGRDLWYVSWEDQRLYRCRPGQHAEPITPAPPRPRATRWADGAVHPQGEVMAVVRERHLGEGAVNVVNDLVLLPVTGGDVETVASGADFVASPRWSPDGTMLCWLEWQHPDMPWDSTTLRVRVSDAEPTVVAGGPGESVFQPQWAPDGSLWFASDRSGWWNLYRWVPGGVVESAVAVQGDIGRPQFVFGQSCYAFLADGRVVLVYTHEARDHLAVRGHDGALVDVDLPWTALDSVQADGDTVALVASSPTQEPAVVRLHVDAGPAPAVETVSEPRDLGLSDDWFSVPEHLSFPTSRGGTAHALFYPPCNPTCTGPVEALPPLLVFVHGGPTAAARRRLALGHQYWTSRGFAVVDVNYRGSTGYGRSYREQLNGEWGVLDVEDCVAAAAWLAERGRVDGSRLCIRGGSAGGFTALAALAFHDAFSAAASHFGVADLEALARETHKFESRYLDRLVGPYPERRDLYQQRSPVHHVDAMDKPLVVFQGLEDDVVPPAQSEMIVEALRAKGVPVAYVAFDGEQHGFRQAANIRRALDGELSFYAQVLDFPLPPDEDIEPVTVEHLPSPEPE